ncbi:RES family NAD+ phosphorylase [Chelatococcus asaccharovorans]|uniref:RES family NAD+ phosphorylase n=1 Tax=Chelatococcus asaccharovorans TaxID=28210 RepID=UPI002264CEB2|nr:RES family NAD+ phosphorylase [Chelatococcus asaccharovorans]
MRIHRKGQGAVFFGPGVGRPPQNRFDAPGSEYGVLYAARRLEGAFVETLLRRPADGSATVRAVSQVPFRDVVSTCARACRELAANVPEMRALQNAMKSSGSIACGSPIET